MLSEEELIKEGECCGLRCRLCPCDPKYTKGTTKLRSKTSKKRNTLIQQSDLDNNR